jgi:peptidoglycan/LPS O-acetylase OafA/YrhL
MVCATMLAALAIVIGYTLQHADWNDAMFANRWFLVFLPLSLFWVGAWLRRPHRPATWVVAASLWGFSALIALVGATDPQPRQGYDHYKYSAAVAFMNLVNPPKSQPSRAIIAGE